MWTEPFRKICSNAPIKANIYIFVMFFLFCCCCFWCRHKQINTVCKSMSIHFIDLEIDLLKPANRASPHEIYCIFFGFSSSIFLSVALHATELKYQNRNDTNEPFLSSNDYLLHILCTFVFRSFNLTWNRLIVFRFDFSHLIWSVVLIYRRAMQIENRNKNRPIDSKAVNHSRFNETNRWFGRHECVQSLDFFFRLLSVSCIFSEHC